MSNKEKLKKIFYGALKLIFEVSFVCSWTITSQNKIVAFFSTALFLFHLNKLTDLLKDCKLIDKLIDNEIMFFHSMKVHTKEGIEEYSFLGFAMIDDKKLQNTFMSADFTQIKTVKGVQYIGYYKKVCQ